MREHTLRRLTIALDIGNIMTPEIDIKEEIEKLRRKAHDHANVLTDHEGRIIDLEETTDTMEKTLIELKGQSKILKYILGVATAIFVSLVTKVML